MSWYLIGGIALFAVSIFIVNRYNLQRGGIFAPLTTPGANKLPTIGALAFGIAGGILMFYGLRG
jgi:hypothetical protein